jgi:hypothetical protein
MGVQIAPDFFYCEMATAFGKKSEDCGFPHIANGMFMVMANHGVMTNRHSRESV